MIRTYPLPLHLLREGRQLSLFLDGALELVDEGGGWDGRQSVLAHADGEFGAEVVGPETVAGWVLGVDRLGQQLAHALGGDEVLLSSGVLGQ